MARQTVCALAWPQRRARHRVMRCRARCPWRDVRAAQGGAGHAASQGCRGGQWESFGEGYSSFSLCHAPFQTIWR